jgi:hypothetical protein
LRERLPGPSVATILAFSPRSLFWLILILQCRWGA